MRTIIRARETDSGVRIKFRDGEDIGFEDIPFRNYFYMKREDYRNNQEFIDKDIRLIDHTEEIDAVNGEFFKIFLKNNLDRWKLKSKLEHEGITLYEADIPANKRWLIDVNPKLNQQGLKTLYYDIETKDDSNFVKDIRGNIVAMEPILCIAYEDDEGNKHFIKNKGNDGSEEMKDSHNDPIVGESKLLNFHMSVIPSYDIISGWNSKGFDDTYVKQRCEAHSISIGSWEYINQLDYMELARKFIYPSLKKYSLDFVAQDILKCGKLEVQEKGNGGILSLWNKSFPKVENGNIIYGDNLLQEYNEMDVSLMKQIEDKRGFIELAKIQADFIGCFVQEILHNSESWDIMFLRAYKERNMIAPTKPNKQEVEKRKKDFVVAGAYTYCLEPGIHENVEVYDFKSFYPTTVAACNICPTTLVNSDYDGQICTIPDDTHLTKGKETYHAQKFFRLDKRGILADLMAKLIDLREFAKYEKFKFKDSDPDKYKQMMNEEWNYKILANSGYGVMAMKGFRFFNEDVANAITQFCRHLNKKCSVWCEELGFKSIQGDTDSGMYKNITGEFTIKDLEIHFAKKFDSFAKFYNINSRNFKHKDLEVEEELKKREKSLKYFSNLSGNEKFCEDIKLDINDMKSKLFIEKPHFIVFEHEKTFSKMLSIKKKNYASLKITYDKEGKQIGEPEVDIVGLQCIKKDTNPLAKEFQKRMIEDVLHNKFKPDSLIFALNTINIQMKNNNLNSKYLIMEKGLNKPFDQYGLPMMDSKTGIQKLTADGNPRFASVPAQVKLAKRMVEMGMDVNVGDMIPYVVQVYKPRIVAITPQEYTDGADYDRDYYWNSIIKPVLAVLKVTHPQVVIDNYKLWKFPIWDKKKEDWVEINEKKAEKYLEKLHKELDKEE